MTNLDTLLNENVDDQSNTLEDLLINDHYLQWLPS